MQQMLQTLHLTRAWEFRVGKVEGIMVMGNYSNTYRNMSEIDRNSLVK